MAPDNVKTVKHFTDLRGMKNIERAIDGDDFDISTPVAVSPFFKKSNVILTLRQMSRQPSAVISSLWR